MRISDWSSDVCSSDLVVAPQRIEIDAAARLQLIHPRARQHARRTETQEAVVGELDRQVQARQDVGVGRAVGDRRRLGYAAYDLRIEARPGLVRMHDLDADIAADRGVPRIGVELRLHEARQNLRSEEHTSELQSIM